MACKTSFELHHHFPKLAEEAGFTFNTHRPRIRIDWNKIRLIDVDSLVKERKFVIIEQHLNDILDCVLESEFDVRILDEGVMKMFRLAQLAVEYQQFCRHYLDRSVYVLREEITSLAQELDSCKKELREKDEELRRLRKRSRHSFKTTLPYNNDNIATMILKTLSHKNDGIMFPSASNESFMQYNKCNYCDKVFLNQLYLKSHISRRHGDVVEPPQKDKQENTINNENTKLSAEVTELRNKIKEMEQIIANTSNQLNNRINMNEAKAAAPVHEEKNYNNPVHDTKKNMKDAEVSTNNEEYFLNKLEEWKKEEHENYNKEMNKLRNQIMETINNIKEKEKDEKKSTSLEPNIILQLHETIKQQGEEIIALKKELTDSKQRTEKENAVRTKEADAQVAFWSNRAETQSKQYEQLLQKLNDVARDAKESRALAEAERERASQLKVLLQQSLNCRTNDAVESTDDVLTPEKKPSNTAVRKKKIKMQPNFDKPEQEPDLNSLEQLHRKAQELLNIASITSSSSDTSTADNIKPIKTNNIKAVEKPTRTFTNDKVSNDIANKLLKNEEEKPQKQLNSVKKTNAQNAIEKPTKLLNGKVPKLKKEKPKPNPPKSIKIRNGPSVVPGSPMKLVRAKITEEVNSRLVNAGVDPLKSRLPQTAFQKQRTLLQQMQELKAKKNPAHDKVRHSILAFLDSNTMDFKKEVTQMPDYISPTKLNKPFKNLTSVISNVKSKALSLVKLNDSNVKEKQKLPHSEVAKRAMSLLKTPPGSPETSPTSTKRSPLKAFITQKAKNATDENIKTNQQETIVTSKKMKRTPSIPKTLQTSIPTSNSDDGSEDSDHKYYKTATVQQSSKSIENLIKSPARRPASAAADYNHAVQKYTISDDNLLRTQSVTNLVEHTSISTEIVKNQSPKLPPSKTNDNSSDDVESLSDIPVKKNFLDENVQNTVKQTKSVLKNASSTSSLNKKKVLFDMDAIQMKSVSASPSQSLTEKSDGHEKYELGLVNLDGEEWDISSIENEPLKNDTKIQNVTRTSPKIAELKEKIESQLARRNDTPTTGLVGRVDVLAGTMVKASSIGGSNTSLGSSILDDSESVPIVNHKTIVKPKKVTAKDDSDIDISEFSIDGIVNKNGSF